MICTIVPVNHPFRGREGCPTFVSEDQEVIFSRFSSTMSAHSKLYSIAFNKCPKCHQGDFFVSKTAFSRNFDKMHARCPHCGENLVPENGFYWGALYVSYGLYVLYCLAAFFLFVKVLKADLDYFLIWLVPSLVLLMPWFFRLARRTWLNIFVNYDPEKARQKPLGATAAEAY